MEGQRETAIDADIKVHEKEAVAGVSEAGVNHSSHARIWKSAAKAAMAIPDPWEEFHLETFPAELVKRHRYIIVEKPDEGANDRSSALVTSDSGSYPDAGAEDEYVEASSSQCSLKRGRNGRWVTDECIVKLQADSFQQGAQRKCFRMKKLSQQPKMGLKNLNWKKASNYVAKIYKKDVDRKVLVSGSCDVSRLA